MSKVAPLTCRWFQFSLTTMFVIVTLLAIPLAWLAWQAHIVRNRQAMRREIEVSGGILFTGHIEWMSSPETRLILRGDYKVKIPFLRKQLGDARVDFIGFNRQMTDADRQAIRSFPEADVNAVP